MTESSEHEYPEVFWVKYGETCWILDDGTTGRPIGGAGPSMESFKSREAAQAKIDEMSAGIHDRESFEIVPSHSVD